ncbi:murein biosynthesis integral membrane protein MurJ [Elstera litoralis]|uniref:murein biosynthesis integral membrane protein MurJ n=1 Tax=Elstera litoralis TaxID=552518 RepID=UPI0009FF7C59|nr:murein biosynthesis integral membrane protein MurJ [Elstera litoralis]
MPPSFARAIATVGGFTMLSRVLGFVRDVVQAAVLGAGPESDAFLVAFKLPNFFRRLFGEGAFNAAFVPVFAGLLATEGHRRAVMFAEQALAVLLAALIVFLGVAEAGMPYLTMAMAPGFIDDPERFNLTVDLARITFPYLLLVSLASLQAGVLNSLDKYAAAAATPILLNLCMIAAMLGLAPILGQRGLDGVAEALAWGVVAPGSRSSSGWPPPAIARRPPAAAAPAPAPEVKKLLKLLLPGVLGAGIMHVNVMIDMMIASLLPTGAVTHLYYADRIAQLPLGVVGAAIATALLPLLTRQIRQGEAAAAQASQNRALEYGLMLTLPATAALIALAEPIMIVLFARGAFSLEDAEGTALVLQAFAVGLPAFVLVKALTPGFFAREDTRTPVRFAIVCLIANLLFNLALMPGWARRGWRWRPAYRRG